MNPSHTLASTVLGLVVIAGCGGKVTIGTSSQGGAGANPVGLGGMGSGGCAQIVCGVEAGAGESAGAAGSGVGGGMPPAMSCTTQTLSAVDSTSLDYKGDNGWFDDMVRAYTDNEIDATGWAKFDLSSVPDGSTISDMHLVLHHQIGYENPLGAPDVVIDYSIANDWARATATSSDIPRTRRVSGKTSSFNIGAWNDFAIQGTGSEWSLDLADNWLTFGVTNVKGRYSYIYFDGTDNPINAPKLVVQICE